MLDEGYAVYLDCMIPHDGVLVVCLQLGMAGRGWRNPVIPWKPPETFAGGLAWVLISCSVASRSANCSAGTGSQ